MNTQEQPQLHNVYSKGKTQLKNHLLWLLFFRVALFTTLIGITYILSKLDTNTIIPEPQIVIAFLAVIYIFSIGSSSLLISNTPNLKNFALVQIIADLLFAAIVIYYTGCSQSVFTPILIMPVIYGGLILNRTGSMFMAALATLFYATILFLEYKRITPPYLTLEIFGETNLNKSAGLLAVYGIIFFVSALISGNVAAKLKITEEQLSKTNTEFDRLSLLYKQIFDDINTGIITIDESDTIYSYNKAAERITGFKVEDALNSSINKFFHSLRLDNMSERMVTDFTRKDQVKIRLAYSVANLHLPGLADKNNVEQYSNHKLITMQDISAVERAEKKLREKEKMASIGELGASIAHDFRNPLAAICGSAQMLEADNNYNSATGKALSKIITRESTRMAKTISDFLELTRPEPLEKEFFNLHELIQESAFTSPLLNKKKEQIKIKNNTPESLYAYGDKKQIRSAFIHLIENSIRVAGKQEVKIKITAWLKDNKEGNGVYIRVSDQGPGIAKEILPDIFKPFFSTRENSSGLGLAIVKQTIEAHCGTIKAENNPGGGCSIQIWLPGKRKT